MAFAVGKWTQETCREMMFDVATRVELLTGEKRIQFFSDGNDDYTYILPDYFDVQHIDYGQIVKIREKGRIVDTLKRVVYGHPDVEDIETTDIDNFHSILRERIGRLVRRTKCISKLKYRLKCATYLFQFHWNFMDPLPNGRTPAMIEGLSNRCWTWKQFFNFRLSDTN